MTGLEKIIQQIENDSNASVSQVIGEAQSLAANVLSDAKAVINDKKALHQKEMDALKATVLERAKSSAELESRKIILSKKLSLISKAIDEAMEKLSSLPTQDYFELLLKLTEKYASDDKAEMQLSQKDLQRLPSDFTSKLPKNINLSETVAKIDNGFLLIFDGIDINCSFSALFNDKTEELQDKTSSILFK